MGGAASYRAVERRAMRATQRSMLVMARIARRSAHLIFCCLICQVALAQTSIDILGLAFPVDDVQLVDDNTAKITLFSETAIVAKAELDGFVVTRNFATPKRIAAFSVANLQQFVRKGLHQASTNNSFDQPVRGLLALMQHPEMQPVKLVEFMRELAHHGAPAEGEQLSDELFRRTVTMNGGVGFDPFVLANLAFLGGERDAQWLQGQAARIQNASAKEFEALVIAELQSAIAEGEMERLTRLAQMSRDVFGAADARARHILEVVETVVKAASYAEIGDLQSLYPVIDASRKDTLLQDLVSPLVVKALHKEALKFITQGRSEQALSLLKEVDMQRRTITTHKLVRQALEALVPGKQSILADVRVDLMLRGLQQKDPSINRAYLQALQAQIAFLADNDDPKLARTFFQTLLLVRPDPSSANDELRAQIVRAALRSGDAALARDLVKEIKTGLPYSQRLKLLFDGLYINRLVVWGIFLAFFASVIGLLVKVAWPLIPRRPVRAIKEGGTFEQEPIEHIFKSQGTPVDYEYDEYARLLAVFALKPGAKAKEIKVAYRNAVKEYHPDANPNADELASQKFIELTNAYDRLMELEENRFGAFSTANRPK